MSQPMYECMSSELDIFGSKFLQTNVLATHQIGYKPISAIERGGNIEFISYGHESSYR